MGRHAGATCAVLLLMVFLLSAVTSDMQEFLANLPADVGSSISNAWNNMIWAIKRPVRIRRLGRTGRTKRPRLQQATGPVLVISTGEEMQPPSRPSTPRSARVLIPFLATPHWKTSSDWKRRRLGMQRANHNRLEPYRFVTYGRTQDGKITTEDDITDFGNLFFV